MRDFLEVRGDEMKRLTEEEIWRIWRNEIDHPEKRGHIAVAFARRIEAEVEKRVRAECLDWIRSEARDCGCSARIEAAILHGGEER
jgi:GTP cyclohydrolase II